MTPDPTLTPSLLSSLADWCLSPGEIGAVGRKRFVDIWAGGNSSFVKTEKNEVLGFGLNSNQQLGRSEVAESVPTSLTLLFSLFQLSRRLLPSSAFRSRVGS
jgi:hypothetical protein